MEMDIQTAIWRGRTTQTIEIDEVGAQTTAVFTPDKGKRFACHYLYLSFAGFAEIASFQLRSGSTDISGQIQVGARVVATAVQAIPFEFCCSGMPIFLGRANGDAFNLVVVNAGGAVTMDGFAVMTQLDGIL